MPQKRLPTLPSSGTIPSADAEAFAYVTGRIPTFLPAEGAVSHDPATTKAQYYAAMANAPTLAAALGKMGATLVAEQGKPGRFSAADHEMIDLVLPLDSGFYALLDQHLTSAVAAGVRIGAIEALRDHRDDLLTSDEYQQVEFIRAVRDGIMTDDIWSRMTTRLGSVRGTVEYCGFVLLLQFHHKFAWALGTDVIAREALDALLAEFSYAAAARLA